MAVIEVYPESVPDGKWQLEFFVAQQGEWDNLFFSEMFTYAFHFVKCPELPVVMPFDGTKKTCQSLPLLEPAVGLRKEKNLQSMLIISVIIRVFFFTCLKIIIRCMIPKKAFVRSAIPIF